MTVPLAFPPGPVNTRKGGSGDVVRWPLLTRLIGSVAQRLELCRQEVTRRNKVGRRRCKSSKNKPQRRDYPPIQSDPKSQRNAQNWPGRLSSFLDFLYRAELPGCAVSVKITNAKTRRGLGKKERAIKNYHAASTRPKRTGKKIRRAERTSNPNAH